MSRRFRILVIAAVQALALVAPIAATRAEIAPPWCGTPQPEGVTDVQSLDPNSFPHIPWYAMACTLERIAGESDGRMTFEVSGQSALGRDMYVVVINALDSPQRRRDFQAWEEIRRVALTDPARAQALLARFGDDVKVPVMISSGIHGGESEGVDAMFQIAERLATTPAGVDPEVDAILDHVILIWNVVQNPDGRIANQRANGNGFDLNRDWLTQSQPETLATAAVIRDWLPVDLLDLHGYVTPTLIEATTKPHNPSIEYDLWLKWNQARIDANEAAMNAVGLAVTRPLNDWCPEGDDPGPDGICDDGSLPGPAVAEGWDDWGPFYTPMYAQHIGLNGSTVEMCNSQGTGCLTTPESIAPRGRLGARLAQYTVSWSTLLYDLANRNELLNDELEIYRRGVTNAPRPECCEAPFETDGIWMHEYPTAYVIPLGAGQRSDVEANRLVGWMLMNGIEVEELKQAFTFDGQTFEKGSYVAWLAQARRGPLDTALGIGVDISADINRLYAPPGAWSHGWLWGADVVQIPRDAEFDPITNPVSKTGHLLGGVEPGPADGYALVLDSATAVRVLNGLMDAGLAAELATESFGAASGDVLPAGTVLFAADPATRVRLDTIGKAEDLWFARVGADGPATEPIEAKPRILVLTGSANQDVWSLRDLGFEPAFMSTTALNAAATDPLPNYDLIWNTGGYPSAALGTARSRLQAFFANGGGYIGALANGSNFLTNGGLVTGLTPATRTGSGRSGIVNWINVGGPTSPIVGAFPGTDTAIMDPPTWFASIPATLAADARFPADAADILAAGLWLQDAQSATAPGSAIIAHGTTTAGTARVTVFAMNPLYRADPEREWSMVGSAAYWADQ
ncbi:MAG: hypothetical protein L0227_04745 [Chloroflexi bacterium]|nr:hypothetical protein [Chloroflexota bacterium]